MYQPNAPHPTQLPYQPINPNPLVYNNGNQGYPIIQQTRMQHVPNAYIQQPMNALPQGFTYNNTIYEGKQWLPNNSIPNGNQFVPMNIGNPNEPINNSTTFTGNQQLPINNTIPDVSQKSENVIPSQDIPMADPTFNGNQPLPMNPNAPNMNGCSNEMVTSMSQCSKQSGPAMGGKDINESQSSDGMKTTSSQENKENPGLTQKQKYSDVVKAPLTPNNQITSGKNHTPMFEDTYSLNLNYCKQCNMTLSPHDNLFKHMLKVHGKKQGETV